MKKEDLAINLHKEEIIEAVKNNKVIIVEAPTGSGKTTQIPQILFNAGINEWGVIGVTQPRRIAAYGVSNRIAFEMGVELGQLVGYKMRFEDKTSANTRIKIMTDGILLEELRSDPLLLKYSILIVDEAHERSLNIDFVLGLLKNILRQRTDLKIVVSSATINPKLFSEFFDNAPIISVETKPYPIEVKYLPLEKKDDYEILYKKIIDIVNNLEVSRLSGGILIFLPGEQSINECCDRLTVLGNNNGYSFAVLPLYARLGHDEQKKVFDDYTGKRKIVVATNIAETSITIDGIIYVIDPGYSKLNYYNPRTFTSYLEAKPISRAAGNQRMGRAGRTAPGVVYRLYSEQDFNSREEFTKEEIYRTDLSEVVLRMADLGISHFSAFDFISPPKQGAIFSAIETLIIIGALDENQRLTDMGKKMVEFPLEPRISRILLESLINYPKVTNNVIIITAFLSAKAPFLYPHGEEIESRNAQKKFFDNGGDFFSWLNLFYKYEKEKSKEDFCKYFYIDKRGMDEIINIHSQLKDMIKVRKYSIGNKFNYDEVIKCVCSGLKQYICKKETRRHNTYYSSTERDIRIHPASYLYGLSPEWIIGGEIVNTGRTYVRSASVIAEKVIKASFPDVFNSIIKRVKKTYITERITKTKSKHIEDNRVYILDKYFEIFNDNKGKFVYVPYNILIQLKTQKEKIMDLDFGNLRAKLIFREVVILSDNLGSLLKYFDKIDLGNGLNTRFPKNQYLLYPDDWEEIYRSLNLLLKPTVTGRNAKQAGFLCIKKLDDDSYQYIVERDFFVALEESIATLEKIFTSSVPAWNDAEKLKMESIFHKLIELSEEVEV